MSNPTKIKCLPHPVGFQGHPCIMCGEMIPREPASDPIHSPREEAGGEEDARTISRLQGEIGSLRAEVERLKGERDEAREDARSWAEAVDCKSGSTCKWVTSLEAEFSRCWTHELRNLQSQLAEARADYSTEHLAFVAARQRISVLERALEEIAGCAWDCAAPGRSCRGRARAALRPPSTEDKRG